MKRAHAWSACAALFSLLCLSDAVDPHHLIGTGMSDVTGPASEVNMMGYANMDQNSAGIHMRLYSRAYIIGDLEKKSRVVFVSVDICMISQLIKLEVVKQLHSLYGNLYTEANVCLSGIHTHSGPGGFHQYVLYGITSLGFVKQNFDVIVSGIVKSIQQAHDNMKPGNIYVGESDLVGSNINRSPSAYLNNPSEERAKYKHNTDTLMTQLNMKDGNGRPIGMINWFAVHPTSMNNTNDLISSDNKGYASYLYERMMNPGSLPGKGSFVAAFAQSNLGDVSPNTKGPHCQDTGKSCDFLHSTCHGKNELCTGTGPGHDMFDSTRIIGGNQFSKAKELASTPSTLLTGPVDFRHQYVDMSNVQVRLNATLTVKTCRPAMGYSFAAGTTDGPGAFDFKQGDKSGNPFWNLIRNLIVKPPADQVACQAPKPILLDTGDIREPYGITWQPEVVPVQVLRVGQLAIVVIPGEFTTMSGRRMRDAVKKTLISNGFPSNTKVVIAGLANTYTSYITTFEEYQVQRYEGASTIFGPHTLSAYIQKYTALAEAIAKGTSVEKGPSPPNLYSKQIGFLPPVVFDCAPLFKHYGDVLTDVKPVYKQGSNVKVVFVSANPRNNLMTDSTFLTVERQNNSGKWEVLYNDANWETRYYVIRKSMLDCCTSAKITWAIPNDQKPGLYRIRHFGSHKNLIEGIKSFSGVSSTFKVVTKGAMLYNWTLDKMHTKLHFHQRKHRKHHRKVPKQWRHQVWSATMMKRSK